MSQRTRSSAIEMATIPSSLIDGRSRLGQLLEHPASGSGNLGHGRVKGSLIGARRFLIAAYFAYELERCQSYFFISGEAFGVS